MRSFSLDIDEQNFNLLWRSLAAREQQLLEIIEANAEDDESDAGPMASNDLMYLRLYQKTLRQKAEQAAFGEGAFSLSDEIIDLAALAQKK